MEHPRKLYDVTLSERCGALLTDHGSRYILQAFQLSAIPDLSSKLFSSCHRHSVGWVGYDLELLLSVSRYHTPLRYTSHVPAPERQRRRLLPVSRAVERSDVAAWPVRRRIWNNAWAMLGPIL
jgi:hypothetical protein